MKESSFFSNQNCPQWISRSRLTILYTKLLISVNIQKITRIVTKLIKSVWAHFTVLYFMFIGLFKSEFESKSRLPIPQVL